MPPDPGAPGAARPSLLTAEDLPKFDEMLSFLTEGEVATLFQHVEERAYNDGDTIFRQGGEGHALYIIKSGSVKIVLEKDDGSRLHLTTLSPGHIIGEIAFLMGERHSASAVADGPTEVLLFQRDDFDAIVLEDPALAFKLLQAINKVLCYRLRKVNRELAATKKI